MKHRVSAALSLGIFILFSPLYVWAKIQTRHNDVLFSFDGSFKPEMFAGVNVSLLN